MKAMRNKKILIVSHGIGDGGAQRVTAMLGNGFAEIGYNVRIVTSAPTDNPYPLDEGVGYYPIQASQKKSYQRVLYRIIFIRRLISKYQPDYILSLSAIPNMMTIIAGGLRERKIVISERTDPSKHPESIMARKVRNLLYHIPKRIVFQTKEAGYYFSKSIRKKGVVIPNAVPYGLNNLEPYCEEREKIIVGVGSLSEQKDWMTAIKAFEIFIEIYQEYKLIIYGEGEYRKLLEDYVSLNPLLCGKVEFPGFVPNIHEAICKSAVFVSSSKYDGISNSILEAMALGLPCICTDAPVGGARMLINDGVNGFLVEVGDYRTLSEKMKVLVKEPGIAKRISKNAVYVRDKFKFDRIIRQLEKALIS